MSTIVRYRMRPRPRVFADCKAEVLGVKIHVQISSSIHDHRAGHFAANTGASSFGEPACAGGRRSAGSSLLRGNPDDPRTTLLQCTQQSRRRWWSWLQKTGLSGAHLGRRGSIRHGSR